MRRICILILLGIVLVKGWYYWTDGFNLHKVLPGYPTSYSWKSYNKASEVPKEVEAILDQEFSYFARGQQSYVFLSQDGKYVIKLMRLHKLRKSFWTYIPYLPPKLGQTRKNFYNQKNLLKHYLFKSYSLTKEHLFDESGLVYLHLEESNDLNKTLLIKDSLGRKHRIQADRISFVIQKKMEPFLPFLTSFADKRKVIDALFETVSFRAQKGIRNKNRRCMKNLGVLDGRIVEYDVGEFRENIHLFKKEGYRDEIIKSTKGFRKWLALNDVKYLDYFDQKVNEL